MASIVVLGPTLGPGMVFHYDLVWSPWTVISDQALGGGGSAPRAVPSDAVAVLLGAIVTPPVAQKIMLLGVLILAGVGAAVLVHQVRPSASAWCACATAVLAIWNPFVAERLLIGHWTVLLGYAVLPWAIRAVLRGASRRRGEHKLHEQRPSPVHPLAWVTLAAVGGANAWVIVAPVVVVLMLLSRWPWRSVLLGVVHALAVSAVWAVPSVAQSTRGDLAGVAAFAARPDGAPGGLVGTLLGGGGIWNTAAIPTERGVPILAAAFTLTFIAGVVSLCLGESRQERWPVVLIAVGLVLLVVLSSSSQTRSLWLRLAEVPGMALLRDSHKLLALWVALGAVGAGVMVDRLSHRRALLMPSVALAALVGPAAMPSLAWGAMGELSATRAPADLAEAARAVDGVDADVALLPWGQYRRYAWNDATVSLSVIPRLVTQRLVYDDSLPLQSGRIAGEDPVAASISAALDTGASPWTALASHDVRYAIIEKDAGLPVPEPPSGARLLWSGVHADVIDLTPDRHGRASARSRWTVAGATVTLGAVLILLVTVVTQPLRRPRKRSTVW